MFKNALVTVSDKTGLVEFLKPLCEQGLRVVSTGGTAEHLKQNGITVVDISQQTRFPEVMGGRVKTLHPSVHMAILARADHPEDFQLLKQYELDPFDLVICNLYPFEASVIEKYHGPDLIEKIDIGGPTVLRAAAKNYSRVTVICDPNDYQEIGRNPTTSLPTRQKLAAKVFAHVSSYDSLVAAKLGHGWGEEFSVAGHKVMDLRYGENPQQESVWYRFLADEKGLHKAEILQGKVLSYNNLLDLEAASSLIRGFCEPAAVAVKHNNPCGAAIDSQLFRAIEKTIASDPVSIFGGIIAVNRPLGKEEAQKLSEIFLECIVAPDFSHEALDVFAKKKNLRILKWPEICEPQSELEMKTISGGFLLQSKDLTASDSKEWKFLSDQATPEILRDLQFGEKIGASLKSNAIALIHRGQTVGLGMGQVNRVDSVKQAIERMRTHFGDLKDVILISDAFFPFPDSVELAASAQVKWILQPGGSVKDQEVIAAAQKLKINMVMTGVRHFKH